MKHLEWAPVHCQDNFEDVLWTDESSAQLEYNKKILLQEKERVTPPKTPPSILSRCMHKLESNGMYPLTFAYLMP